MYLRLFVMNKKMLEILLPHSSSKLELQMNFNAIFKNVKTIKISEKLGNSGGTAKKGKKSLLEPPLDLFWRLKMQC